MADVDESRHSCPQCAGEDSGVGDSEHESWNERVRGETPMQREDRRYGELLQELRVAQTGIQILLAFLFTAAFSPGFQRLQDYQRVIYVVTLLLGAGATALLIAPVSIHRLLFGQQLKPQIVRAANVLTFFGLVLMGLTVGSALLLVLDYILPLDSALWLTGGVMLWFVAWWYALPLVMRGRHEHDSGAAGGHEHHEPGHQHPRDGGRTRRDDRDRSSVPDQRTGTGSSS
jgi:hypothetical protein